MPHLDDDPATLRMHRIRHLAPAFQRLRRIETGHVGIALALLGDRRSLGDQQAGRRALLIIGDVQCVQNGTG
ncbi:hypothetical protein D9M70_510570 [compost metagenome]